MSSHPIDYILMFWFWRLGKVDRRIQSAYLLIKLMLCFGCPFSIVVRLLYVFCFAHFAQCGRPPHRGVVLDNKRIFQGFRLCTQKMGPGPPKRASRGPGGHQKRAAQGPRGNFWLASCSWDRGPLPRSKEQTKLSKWGAQNCPRAPRNGTAGPRRSSEAGGARPKRSFWVYSLLLGGKGPWTMRQTTRQATRSRHGETMRQTTRSRHGENNAPKTCDR